ncbi:hypothetical protein BD626DRAFT_478853 [Schizophyllum amplum]|uniref:XRRM domain-containing protein n=1 Tax=Schizophyllum amplum TaxID=97359 RepID=A0A550CRN6_9AGAR|nr:hypothetical protein BD626DRAFT_478853 [Auriculariopsis ampla]
MFLPRALTKGNKNQLRAPPRATHSIPISSTPENILYAQDLQSANEADDSTTKGKSKDSPPNEDHASIVLLALSDYALWEDAEWSADLHHGHGGASGAAGDTGYVSLSRVFARLGMKLDWGEEMLVVRALRHYCPDVVEVRMIVADPSSSSGTGGYEVRRRVAPTRRFSSDDWDARTVYLENIPQRYRTLSGVHCFAAALLNGGLQQVAHVAFPSTPSDRSGVLSKCKGYALVTMLDPVDVARLTESYPWRGVPADLDPKGTDAHSEATRFGLRALSKARWNELQAEYQARKARVMEEIAAYEDEQLAGMVHDPKPPQDMPPREQRVQEPVPSRGPALDAFAPYPYGCLVFVRGLHTETNKTTLKKLFGRALAGDGIDYVDYAKGMDSCHLRLTTPTHAERLHEYFTTRSVRQTSGLDDAGEEEGGVGRLSTEIVLGRREEVYWEKVPAKVRAQAVAKAMAPSDIGKLEGEADAARPKKRRKR